MPLETAKENGWRINRIGEIIFIKKLKRRDTGKKTNQSKQDNIK